MKQRSRLSKHKNSARQYFYQIRQYTFLSHVCTHFLHFLLLRSFGRNARFYLSLRQLLSSSYKNEQEMNFLKKISTNFHRSVFSARDFFKNKVPCLRPGTVLKKRLQHRCFSVNFAKILRVPFLQNTSGRLLLKLIHVFL